MSRSAVRARPGQDRTGLYEEITNKIISQLEAGRLPWVQAWGSSGVSAPLAMPKNAATGRGYSGINVLILWGAVLQHGFPAQSWLTFRQALGLGGNVRKGERGTTVVYADRFIPDGERRRSREMGEEAVAIPFLKRFAVFNTAQCDGLPDGLVAVPPPVPEGLIVPEVEALIRASGADLRLGGDKAFMRQRTTTSSCRGRRAISSRSTGIARLFTNFRIGVEQPQDWVGTSAGLSARSPTRAKNWLPKWRARSSAPRSASCRPCAMPITLAPGSRFFARTIARSSALRVARRRRPTISSAFSLTPIRSRSLPRQTTNRRRRDGLAPKRKVDHPCSRFSGFPDPRL
jgi:hypothetical protein